MPVKVFNHELLRRFIGLFAISIGSLTAWLSGPPLASISASYWSTDVIYLIAASDLFVGGLCVVGLLLLAYRGRNSLESNLSKVGCGAAFAVAFFPTAPNDCVTCGSVIHGPAAFALFVVLLIFIWSFSNRAKSKGRDGRKWFYRACAIVIGLSLVLALYGIVTQNHAERIESRIIFYAEVGALVPFGLAWIWAGFYATYDKFIGARQQPNARPDVEYVVAQGAPNLFDLDLSTNQIVLWINNPGHLSLALQVITSFRSADSATAESLGAFAAAVELTCRGGNVLDEPIEFEVQNVVSSPYLEASVGPDGTYANRLILGTRDGSSFHSTIEACLNPTGVGGGHVFLHPVLSDLRGHHGHHEYLLPLDEPDTSAGGHHDA